MQQNFIQFALDTGVLKFGEFQLKSGRISPYFFNAGLFCQGAHLAKLGRFYAQAIVDAKIEFDVLFGPAYKGIPLAAATAIALAEQHNIDKPYCFNRKETKQHGEGGKLVGAALQGRVLVIDDVITAGTAIRESANIIQQSGAELAAVVILLDRQERGDHGQSAIQEVATNYDIQITSIATLANLLAYLQADIHLSKICEAVSHYQQQYGIKI